MNRPFLRWLPMRVHCPCQRERSMQLLFWSVMSLLLPMPLTAADQTLAEAKTPVNFEELSERFQNTEAPVAKKARDLLAVVDSESGAQRIPEPLAQGLRWTLGSFSSTEAVDVLALLDSTRVPLDNAAVMEGALSLDAAERAARTERAALKTQAIREATKRSAEFVRDGKSVAEIDAFLGGIERFQNLTKKYPHDGANRIPASDLSACITLMHSLRGIIALKSSGDSSTAESAVAQFQQAAFAAPEFASLADYSKRASGELAFLHHAADVAREDLRAALLAGKPEEQIGPLAGNLVEAANRYSHVVAVLARDSSSQAYQEREASWQAYGPIYNVSRLIASHQVSEARAEMASAREFIPRMAPRQAVELEALLGKLEGQIGGVAEPTSREFEEQLHAKLSAVKQPSDLAAIALDLSHRQRETPAKKDSRIAQGPAQHLFVLASAWSGEDLNLLAVENQYEESEEDAGILALRDRIERELLSRSFDAPELIQAPFGNQPLGEAIERLLSTQVAERKWLRVLQAFRMENMYRQLRGMTPRNQAATFAVRSYLTGKSFEAAGMWTQAAAAYKSVLAAVSGLAPVVDAADRLKALAKEHPEAVGTAVASAPPEMQ